MFSCLVVAATAASCLDRVLFNFSQPLFKNSTVLVMMNRAEIRRTSDDRTVRAFRAASVFGQTSARASMYKCVSRRFLPIQSAAIRKASVASTSNATDPTPWLLIPPDFPPIALAQTMFESVHALPMPWWATIVSTTILLRSIVTLPLAIHQNRITAKIAALAPTAKEYSDAVRHRVVVACRRANLPASEANRRYRKELRAALGSLYRAEGCSPWRVAILPWIQLPLWIALSLGLRNVCGAYPGVVADSALVGEGILWFSDLAAPDSYWILPVALGVSNLANIQLNVLRRKKGSVPSRFSRILTNSFRVLTVGMVYVAGHVPAALSLYWVTSSAFGLVQNVAFKFPAVRRLLRIPKAPGDLERPFRDIRLRLREGMQEFLEKQR